MSQYNPHFPNSAATLSAASEWRDRCLRFEGSIFDSGEALWTSEVLEELDERFNGHPDEGNDRFLVKLKRQLAEASPRASMLMAELFWAMHLFPSNIGPDSKRRTIVEIWNWSGRELSLEHPKLDRDLLKGLGSAGPGFLAHRWRELRFFINASLNLKSREDGDRQALLNSPWSFARWLDAVPDEGYRQLKHILPFVLFPDEFERISSPGDVRKILVVMGGMTRGQLREMAKVEQDEALLHLRDELENKLKRPFDFYEPELKTTWDPREPAIEPVVPEVLAPQPSGSAPASTAPLNQILYGPPGTGKTYRTIDKALAILDPAFARNNEGDRGALKGRFDELVEAGRIRFVTFHQSFSYEEFVEGIRAEVRPDGSLNYYVAHGVLKDFLVSRPRLKAGARVGGYLVSRCTKELLWLEKPNGSDLPLAWELIDQLSALLVAGRITLEDVSNRRVFEKIPDSRLEKYIVNGYANVLGPLLETLREVSRRFDDSERKVLIIDEINRGNISKIFGELITLIEPSKRAGADEELSAVLPYSKVAFSIPGGLHIIGTMNTADRSLATIDMALRRRFTFEEVEPDAASLEGVEIAGVELSKLLQTMNDRIEALLDRDHRIGHAYFINLIAADSIDQLRDVFATQIIPLLQEYFFDDWQRLRLVLNDHRKGDPTDRFVLERDQTAEGLFGAGDLEVPTSTTWRINEAAFGRPSAYRTIIG